MAVKFKLNKRVLVIGLIAVLGLFALVAGRSDDTPEAGTLDGPADQACTEFALGYPGARSSTARLSLADQVTASSQKSDNDAIRDRANAMGRSADETNAEWETSADALTEACRAAGWSAP